ncbi:hypothetical protein [Flavobacterium sp.]|uniref:hypothetical protein n=1 Tax=Flavobacterium sp. TaxID=239 RepID=UPI003F6A1BF4
MENYLYIPVNSLNFNNILSSESISPQIFYEKRGYGFKRFEKSNINSFTNSILVYNKIPITHDIKSDREEFIFYLAVPSNLIKKETQKHNLNNFEIFQLDYTLYINSVECFFITRTKNESLKLIASTNRSIEVKNVDNYEKNLKSLEEYKFEKDNFNYDLLEKISDFKNYNHDQIVFDRKVNKIKGFVYGYLSGHLNELPKEILKAKLFYQEFINTYSLLSNELSTTVNQKNNYYQKGKNKEIEGYYDKLQELIDNISLLLDIYDASSIENNVVEDFNFDIDTLKDFKKYNSKKLKKSLYQILLDLFKDSNLESLSIEELLNYLISQSKRFSQNTSIINYNSLEAKFNLVRGIIYQKFNEIELANSNCEKINELPFEYDVKKMTINLKSKELEQNELFLYNLILKEFLSLEELSTADEIGQRRLNILATIGKLSTESKVFEKDSEDIKYLRKLYDSLKTIGIGFKINDTESVALQSLACFLNRYSDFEKLTDYMMKNNVSKNSFVMGIWGAAYGFSNTSKLVLAPLFRNNDILIEAIQLSNNIATSQPIYENTLYKFVSELERNTIFNTYTIKSEISIVKEPLSDKLDKKDEFLEIIISNKKLRGNDEWIKIINDCFKLVDKEIRSGELFDSSNAKLDLFIEKLIVKAKETKGFGDAKINEAIDEYSKFLKIK